MKSYTFNLVDEKWIPSIQYDGTANELGLLATLTNAHEIREVFDSSPVVTASLHRLLLAILHRNFSSGSAEEWSAIWETGYFDKKVLEDYFRKWYRRFDLFDEEHPFYQIADFGKRRKKIVPVNDLLPEKARGNTPTLFDHTIDDAPEPLTAAEAARGLVAIQAFKLGGLSGLGPNFVDAPCARNVVLIVRGQTLFETLMLNLVHYDPDENEPIPSSNEDCPIWEQEQPLISPTPRGYLDYLTWQTVLLRLRTDGQSSSGVRIKNLDMALGRNLINDGDFFDPAVAYQKNKKGGWYGLRFREDKAIWRDSTSLLSFATEDKRPPGILRWIGMLVRKGIVEESNIYRLDAYGLGTSKAKIDFWRHERLPLPMDYLADPSLVQSLQVTLNQAEETRKAIGKALWIFGVNVVCSPQGTPDREAISNYVSHLGANRLFWSRLETPFYRLLPNLPKDREKTIDDWVTRLRQTARDIFSESIRDLDRSARMLRAMVQAERSLNAGLRKALE